MGHENRSAQVYFFLFFSGGVYRNFFGGSFGGKKCVGASKDWFSFGTRAGPKNKTGLSETRKGGGKIYDAWSVGVLQVEEESSFGIQSRSNWIGLVTAGSKKNSEEEEECKTSSF